LKDKEFCNLTEQICRVDDTEESLMRKTRIATILGTIQSSLTSFQFLSPEWKANCEEERLLGVSMTGVMDCPLLNGNGNTDSLISLLERLRTHARSTNKVYADRLSISPSMAITCNKPSGTVSELVSSSSGIHPRYSPYYIRSIRQDNKDPVTQFLKEQGVYSEPSYGKEETTTVFFFPQQAPEGSVYRNDRTALQQLEHWLLFQRHWCDHKPSVTIYVKEHEWFSVGAWVYEHFDEVSGVSFLPHSDHSYKQAPFDECTKERYEELLLSSPKSIDWNDLIENTDTTIASQELACVAGQCTI
jgi:ribonucleoside-triphosphate reductase